jgi:hypothetical protein
MLVKAETIENYSHDARELVDGGIPGGRMKIAPGQQLSVSQDVWRRICRRCSTWLRRVGGPSLVTTETLKRVPGIQGASRAGMGGVVSTAKKKPAGKGKPRKSRAKTPAPDVESPQVDGKKPLESLGMPGIKEIAAGLDIHYKVGMSKADIIQAIREKRAATTEESNET